MQKRFFFFLIFFALAESATAMAAVHQELSSQRLRLEQGQARDRILSVARKSLVALAIAAIHGDTAALQSIQEIAVGQYRASPSAQRLIDLWPRLSGLLLLRRDVDLAKAVAQMVSEERKWIVGGLLSGKLTAGPVLATQMESFLAVFEFMHFLESVISLSPPSEWIKSDPQAASVIWHDEIRNPMSTFAMMIPAIQHSTASSVSKYLSLFSQLGKKNRITLLSVVETAVLQNLLGLLAKRIDVKMSISDSVLLQDGGAREALGAMIRELLVNAIKYCDEDKTHKIIEITWSAGVLSISDNGIGIQSGQAVLLDGNRELRKEGAPGSGKGLALIQERAKHYAMHMTLESVLRVATTFRFTIPQAVEVPPVSDTCSELLTANPSEESR